MPDCWCGAAFESHFIPTVLIDGQGPYISTRPEHYRFSRCPMRTTRYRPHDGSAATVVTIPRPEAVW